LAPDENALDAMFGSREKAKDEVLAHWKHANQNDDLHRFNIEGMKEKETTLEGEACNLVDGKWECH
jgi:hypothetical protein